MDPGISSPSDGPLPSVSIEAGVGKGLSPLLYWVINTELSRYCTLRLHVGGGYCLTMMPWWLMFDYVNVKSCCRGLSTCECNHTGTFVLFCTVFVVIFVDVCHSLEMIQIISKYLLC